MHSYATEILADADRFARAGATRDALRTLRRLPLADFCQLHLEVEALDYPGLASILSRMPSEADQKLWTGNFGPTLMARSCNTIRLIDIMCYRSTGSGLAGKRILDYGCGWGRLLRLAHYYSEPDNVFGVDPWIRSVELCQACGMSDNIALCDALPDSIPFADRSFDIAFSFSVFTHLSEHAARAVLRACRSAISSYGRYIVTIRPKEFWSARKTALRPDQFDAMMDEHARRGFAFLPTPLAGEEWSQTYGETSISLEFMEQMAAQEGWSVEFYDRDFSEPYQLAVMLRPERQ